MTTAILFSFFSLPVGCHYRLRRRSFVSRGPPHYSITVIAGTRMTFSHNLVILKGPSWGPLNRSLWAFSLALNGHSGYLGASLLCDWVQSSGLCWPWIYSLYLYRLPTVFVSVLFHSVPCAFVFFLAFVDNFLIDLLMGFGLYHLFNLPLRCHWLFCSHSVIFPMCIS